MLVAGIRMPGAVPHRAVHIARDDNHISRYCLILLFLAGGDGESGRVILQVPEPFSKGIALFVHDKGQYAGYAPLVASFAPNIYQRAGPNKLAQKTTWQGSSLDFEATCHRQTKTLGLKQDG